MQNFSTLNLWAAQHAPYLPMVEHRPDGTIAQFRGVSIIQQYAMTAMQSMLTCGEYYDDLLKDTDKFARECFRIGEALYREGERIEKLHVDRVIKEMENAASALEALTGLGAPASGNDNVRKEAPAPTPADPDYSGPRGVTGPIGPIGITESTE